MASSSRLLLAALALNLCVRAGRHPRLSRARAAGGTAPRRRAQGRGRGAGHRGAARGAGRGETAMPTVEDDGRIAECSLGPSVIRSGETLQPSSRDIQPSLEARNLVPPGACNVLSREPGCPPSPVPSSQPSSESSTLSASESSSCTTSYASIASSEDSFDNVMSSITDRYSPKKREDDELACSIGQMAESLVLGMPFRAQLHFMEKMLTVIKDINGAVVAGSIRPQRNNP